MPLTPAPAGYPIKLVRDRTAEIINASGEPGDLFYGPLANGEDSGVWLRRKLAEEISEYIIDPGLDELADALAVIEALAVEHGADFSTLVKRMQSDKRGGFLNHQMMYGRHEEFDSR